MKKIKLEIKGMHCQACSKAIEEELNSHKGISMVKVNHRTGVAVVVFDEEKVSNSDIKKLISKAGDYSVVDAERKKKKSLDKIELFFRIIMSVAAIGSITMIILYFGQNKSEPTTPNVIEQRNVVANNRPAPTPTPAKVSNIEVAKSDHVRGEKDAPITIVEFSDFQCPYCARFHETMKEVIADYPNDVRWVYKHFPLDSIHPLARKAAEASECASDQDKFWEYSDAVFAAGRGLNSSSLETIADNIGLNVKKFNSCLDSGKYTDKVEADYQAGIGLGVRGTPGSFINGKSLSGAVPYNQLVAEIESLLQ